MATGVPTTETAQSPRVEVPEEGLRQIRRWAWVIALGSFLFGYDTGVISGALLFLREDLNLNDFQQGSVVSVLLLGAIAGALSVGQISDRLGRGRILTLNQLLITLGLLVAYLVDWAFAASENWRAMFAVGLIPSLALVLGSLRLPESPVWLLHHGKEAQMRSLVKGQCPAARRLARPHRLMVLMNP